MLEAAHDHQDDVAYRLSHQHRPSADSRRMIWGRVGWRDLAWPESVCADAPI